MTDDELMLAVCNGDQSAYQIIVGQHLKSISHYAYRMLGNKKDTEDITQETFLRLWMNAGKWQPGKAKLSTWLHRITHNLCVDYQRKHGRVQTWDNLENEIDHRQELRVNPDEHEASQEQVGRLEQALINLPENQRSALMLCHYSGFSNKEAAAIMDVSVKALESAIARAKRTLRKTLSEPEIEGSI